MLLFRQGIRKVALERQGLDSDHNNERDHHDNDRAVNGHSTVS